MRKHVLELHEQSGRPFQCMVPSCGVKFARKRYLRRHENLSHKRMPARVEGKDITVGSPTHVMDSPVQRPNTLYLGATGPSTESCASTQIGYLTTAE